jgi:hypothetical protein
VPTLSFVAMAAFDAVDKLEVAWAAVFAEVRQQPQPQPPQAEPQQPPPQAEQQPQTPPSPPRTPLGILAPETPVPPPVLPGRQPSQQAQPSMSAPMTPQTTVINGLWRMLADSEEQVGLANDRAYEAEMARAWMEADVNICRLIELPAARIDGATEERRRLAQIALPEIHRERMEAKQRMQQMQLLIDGQQRQIERLELLVGRRHPYGSGRNRSRSRSSNHSVQ